MVEVMAKEVEEAEVVERPQNRVEDVEVVRGSDSQIRMRSGVGWTSIFTACFYSEILTLDSKTEVPCLCVVLCPELVPFQNYVFW